MSMLPWFVSAHTFKPASGASFPQDLCNDRGTCNCDGMCECDGPYSGTFCEVCDANSEVCLVSNCDSNIDCANCILDLVAPAADSIETTVFFSRAMMNLTIPELPMNYIWSLNPDDNGESELITLPVSHCSQCPNGAVIVNGTESTDYRIDGMKNFFALFISL